MINNLTTELTEITEMQKDINELTELVIGCAIEVHRALGPGLLESAYEICLCREFSLRNVPFECQKPLPLTYKGVKLDCGYRADVIVDGRVLVEVKSVDELAAIHDAQLLSYLKLSDLKVGLLINFKRTRSHARHSPEGNRPTRRNFALISVFSVISVVKYNAVH